MRTTIDIDDDVLAAAKELANAQGTTAGRVISDLARKALTQLAAKDSPEASGLVQRNGFRLLPRRGEGVVTSEMVERLLEEADLEDAGLKPE